MQAKVGPTMPPRSRSRSRRRRSRRKRRSRRSPIWNSQCGKWGGAVRFFWPFPNLEAFLGSQNIIWILGERRWIWNYTFIRETLMLLHIFPYWATRNELNLEFDFGPGSVHSFLFNKKTFVFSIYVLLHFTCPSVYCNHIWAPSVYGLFNQQCLPPTGVSESPPT